MSMLGGPAQPVVTSTEAPDAGPARPVAVVTAPLYTTAGPPLKVVPVADGRPRLGGPALPVVLGSGAAGGGPPVPVYVVSGSVYIPRVLSLYPANLIGYWVLDERSGTTADDRSAQGNDGTYAAAGITYGVDGIADGSTAVAFNGNNTYVQIGSAGFAADWNGDKGSAIAWAKADSAARWSDGLVAWWFHVRATDDANYNIAFGKISNNTIQWRRRSGGAITSVSKTVGAPVGWEMMGMTWDLAIPEIRAYHNGVLVGTSATGFTTWAPGTHLPQGGESVLYAGSLTLQEWFGSGAQVACWADRVLTADEMASLGHV